MADFLVLQRYEGVFNDRSFKMRAGDVISDLEVPVTSLVPFGLSVLPYVPATMAASVARFRERYGSEEWPEGMGEILRSSGLSGGPPPITNAGNPTGAVVGLQGQFCRDTVGGVWYQCVSSPSGTAWIAYYTRAELNSVVPGTEGASLIGTDAKASLGGATTLEGALNNLDGKNPPARSSGALNPNLGAGTVGAIGDLYVNEISGQTWINFDGTVTGWVLTDPDVGVAATLVILQSGQPAPNELLTVGADVYEADGVGLNLNFAIGIDPATTMANLLAEAVANGTVDLLWDAIGATMIRVISADAPQGNVVAGNPNIAVVNGLANYLLSTGTPGNFNTQFGRAPGLVTRSVAEIVVTAAHVAIGEIRVSFPFPVAQFSVHCRTSADLLLVPDADTFEIDGGDVLVSLGGGVGDLAAGDLVFVLAIG